MTPLAPHRQLIAHLETALDCLEEAHEADGYLPHWAQRHVAEMAETLAEVLERLGREVPALGPLDDDETAGEP
jgi:hypothetical protein